MLRSLHQLSGHELRLITLSALASNYQTTFSEPIYRSIYPLDSPATLGERIFIHLDDAGRAPRTKRNIKAGHMLFATAARLAEAREKRKNSCRGRSSFGGSRLCLFSLLEPSSSRSQCLLHLFLVQLTYPRSQNCCVAQKA